MARLTRRDFLKIVSAGTCGAAIHRMTSPLNNMLAFAAGDINPTSAIQHMIIVNLAGGVSSYNMCPLYLPAYYDKNPTISYRPENSIALTSEIGLHPALTALQPVYAEGRLAILSQVGYPQLNRSHDESTAIMHRGIRFGSSSVSGGWAARMTCQMASAFGGASLDGSNLLIQGECNPPRALGSLSDFGENQFLWDSTRTKWMRDKRTEVLFGTNPALNEKEAFVINSNQSLDRNLETIRTETNINLPVSFPNTGFGRQCRDAAKLIMAPSLGTQFIYLQMGGFDTHSGERQRLTQLLTELNGGLGALINCLKVTNHWQDTVITTMSEFNRTHENGSQGTDHGHAGAWLMFGGHVAGGVKTPPPSAAQTVGQFYSDYYLDFREPLKATVNAMGFNGDIVFPEQFSSKYLNLFS